MQYILQNGKITGEIPALKSLQARKNTGMKTLTCWLNAANTRDAKTLEVGDGKLCNLANFSNKKKFISFTTSYERAST